MKARDYAISLGLAQPTRGRMSREAWAAIDAAIAEGKRFSDYNGTKVSKTVPKASNNSVDVSMPNRRVCAVTGELEPLPKVYPPLPVYVERRKQTVAYGIDRGTKPGHSAKIIAIDMCDACEKPIRFCTHDMPQLPKHMGGGDAMLVKPKL